MNLARPCALPDESDDPEADDDGGCKVGDEESLGCCPALGLLSKGPDGNVELSDEDEDDEEGTEHGTVNATGGAEGELLSGVSLGLPCLTETNVGDANGEPGEEGGETRKSEEPVEDSSTDVGGQVDVGDGGEAEDEDERVERATGLVDVGEEPGGIASLGESGKGTRTCVDTRETNGKNRDTDGDVDEVVHAVDTGLVHDNDEGGDVGTFSVKETWVVVGNSETDDKERGDVDESNTPEGLLDGSRHSLTGVGGLSGGKTDELGTGKGESGSDEHSANTLESVGESSRVLP